MRIADQSKYPIEKQHGILVGARVEVCNRPSSSASRNYFSSLVDGAVRSTRLATSPKKTINQT